MSGRATRRSGAPAGVLILHFLFGFVWLVFDLAFLDYGRSGWTDLVLFLGISCWLGAAALIVIGWQSGSHWYGAVPIVWATVFSIAAIMTLGGPT
jgi:hypothetical protein